MRETRLLYFVLGVLTVVGLGAVVRGGGPSGMSFGPTGITFPDGTIQATAAVAAPARRSYYQTSELHQGDAVLDACAAGYHMASMFEILDPTVLQYEPSLGLTLEDAGMGPPTTFGGWVRTGFYPYSTQANSSSAGDGGFVNCDAWTNSTSQADGTVANLSACWQEAADCVTSVRNVAPWWEAGERACDTSQRVWCVAD